MNLLYVYLIGWFISGFLIAYKEIESIGNPDFDDMVMAGMKGIIVAIFWPILAVYFLILVIVTLIRS